MLIGESNVAIDPAIGGHGAADIYLGEFSPHYPGAVTVDRVGVASAGDASEAYVVGS